MGWVGGGSRRLEEHNINPGVRGRSLGEGGANHKGARLADPANPQPDWGLAEPTSVPLGGGKGLRVAGAEFNWLVSAKLLRFCPLRRTSFRLNNKQRL